MDHLNHDEHFPRWGLNTGNITTNADGSVPITVGGGTSAADGAKAQTNVFHLLRTNRWTTLWREDGVKLWEETGKASSYIVAFPIQK